MDVNTAAGAARRLSVDVANLSYRVAFLEQERGELVELAMMLTPGTWQRSMEHPRPSLVTDPDEYNVPEQLPPVQSVTISGPEVEVLDRIIILLQNLM